MKTIRLAKSAAFLLLAITLTGCAKKSAATPVVQSVLTTWQQGDHASAISQFVATDWSRRPLFAPGSAMNLSETQFGALPKAEAEAKMQEFMPQLGTIRDVTKAVIQAGVDAAGKGDSAKARKYFESVKQFATALDSPEHLKIVELAGRGIQKMADAELAKLKS
jgi:hypothetical protein